jgi:hypothetical protein
MGGFVFIIFIFPLTIILAIIWLLTKHKFFAYLIGMLWTGIFGLYSFSPFWTKKKLEKDDIYGEYVIDRTKFSGKQADWQYEHFRFEITKDNDFIFYQTDNDEIIRSYKGKVEFLDNYYNEPRIVLHMNSKGHRHHIIEDKPTLYRQVWTFYYVFNSPKFGNVFFTKGQWKPIDN